MQALAMADAQTLAALGVVVLAASWIALRAWRSLVRRVPCAGCNGAAAYRTRRNGSIRAEEPAAAGRPR